MTLPRPHVTYYVAASLDGFIATPDGGLDWLRAYETEVEDYGYQKLLDRTDCLIMGHRTYQHCLALSNGPWPYPQRPCRVLTTWLPGAPAALPVGVKFTDQSPPDLLAELAQQGYRHCWLVGGGETAGAFLQAGVIDEILLTLVPVVLGQGIALFGDCVASPGHFFSCRQVRSYPAGLVQIHYEK